MIFENKKISMSQTKALFISEVFATAVVFMPTTAWSIMKGKSVFAAVAATLILLLCCWAICAVFRGSESFGKTIYKNLGTTLGNICILAFLVKIVLVTGLWLRDFSRIIHSTMLGETPYQFIAAVIAVVCFYLAQKDMEVRGRTAEIFLIIMALLFIPVLVMVAIGADYTKMLPVNDIGVGDMAKTTLIIFGALGSADYLWFLYPKTNKDGGGISTAVAVVGILLVATMIIVFSVFGDSVMDKSWPVLNMMDTVDFPGAFIERQDVLMIGFWILSFYIYISGGITYGAYLLKEITGKTNYLITGVMIFAVSIFSLPVGLDTEKVMIITAPIFLIVLPVVLLAAKCIRRRAK